MNELCYNGNTQVKKDGVIQNYTAHELQEYIACRDSVEYFCENYVKVISLDHGLTPFKLRGYQTELVKHYAENQFSIVLAPRQSGKSITSVAFILHYAIFNADKKIGILANKGATAREMLSRITLMLENIPFFLQPGCKTLNKGSIKFSNNSEIIAAATSGSSIRGLSLNCVMIDEFSFVNDAETFYTSTYPVITSGNDVKVIITSTPNGIGNMFYKLWKGATQKQNEFKPFTIKWWDVPGRDEEWKRKTIANTSERQFKQEFECAFIGSTPTLVDGDILLGLQSHEPIKVWRNVKYYVEPKAGHNYILTVDVGKGRGQDYSTFIVFDVTAHNFEIVCVYRDNMISPLMFPEYIVRVGAAYNNALVIIENNDAGQVVCNSVAYDYDYENMFVSNATKRDGLGVYMTKRVKRIGCSNLKDIIESGRLEINDHDAIVELSSFEPKGDSYAASGDCHDDLVMNMVLFAWFISTESFSDYSTHILREILYKEKINAIDEDLPPFGVISSANYGDSLPDSARYYQAMADEMKEWNDL
jgi:hypothetical protein